MHQSKNNLSNHRDQTSEYTHLSYSKPENIRLKPNNNYQHHHLEANHDVFKNEHRIDRVGYEYDYYDDHAKDDLSASSSTTTEAANDEYEYYNDDQHKDDDDDNDDPDFEYFYYYTYEYVDPENLQSEVEKLPKPSYRLDEKNNETKTSKDSNVQ